MIRLLFPVGVWEHDLPVEQPCTVCGQPATFAYSATPEEQAEEPYCSLRHWADKADERVQLSGTMVPPDTDREVPFQDKAWAMIRARWPDSGTPGVTEAKNPAGDDVLLYRDQQGRLLGALSHSRQGRLNVIVDPTRRGEGIGRALVRAAGRRWPIDLSVQQMTPAGYRLVEHIDPRGRGAT